MSMHAERHLAAFTEELSTRREWLISHQLSSTEAISMKLDGRRRDALGNLPPEMQSNDGSAAASEDESMNTAAPLQNKQARERQKKRKRTGNQQPCGKRPETPRTSVAVPNPPAAAPKPPAGDRPQRTNAPSRDPPRGQVTDRDNCPGRRTESRRPQTSPVSHPASVLGQPPQSS